MSTWSLHCPDCPRGKSSTMWTWLDILSCQYHPHGIQSLVYMVESSPSSSWLVRLPCPHFQVESSLACEIASSTSSRRSLPSPQIFLMDLFLVHLWLKILTCSHCPWGVYVVPCVLGLCDCHVNIILVESSPLVYMACNIFPCPHHPYGVHSLVYLFCVIAMSTSS